MFYISKLVSFKEVEKICPKEIDTNSPIWPGGGSFPLNPNIPFSLCQDSSLKGKGVSWVSNNQKVVRPWFSLPGFPDLPGLLLGALEL